MAAALPTVRSVAARDRRSVRGRVRRAAGRPRDAGGEPGADLREGTRRTVATLLACGVDPAKANVILQSQFPEILELQWVLGTAISLGRLRKLANFDRRAMAGEGDSVGQCLYPLLVSCGCGGRGNALQMAADVLCSDSETIIAGEDQACHVGLIREVAEKLNHRLEAPVVRVPQWHRHCGFRRRVLSLDGGDKMSKSNPKASARINLTDDDAAIGSKLRAAKTTTTGRVRAVQLTDGADPAAPEVANLLRLLRFFSGDSLSSDWGAAGGLQCRALKEELHRALSAHLSPIRAYVGIHCVRLIAVQAVRGAGGGRGGAGRGVGRRAAAAGAALLVGGRGNRPCPELMACSASSTRESIMLRKLKRYCLVPCLGRVARRRLPPAPPGGGVEVGHDEPGVDQAGGFRRRGRRLLGDGLAEAGEVAEQDELLQPLQVGAVLLVEVHDLLGLGDADDAGGGEGPLLRSFRRLGARGVGRWVLLGAGCGGLGDLLPGAERPGAAARPRRAFGRLGRGLEVHVVVS
ncbi:tryptophan-tRNA ligase [Babesia caballi]|uniref:tryptophan--tRNA ligase n=1 Tax=Babesia caballi TaxID=5871 RepID=A0AAV4LRE3_BABCB|nr:tryptophan-tRNA ligase [Babesia caballi]